MVREKDTYIRIGVAFAEYEKLRAESKRLKADRKENLRQCAGFESGDLCYKKEPNTNWCEYCDMAQHIGREYAKAASRQGVALRRVRAMVSWLDNKDEAANG
jgi:hypothetical protein